MVTTRTSWKAPSLQKLAKVLLRPREASCHYQHVDIDELSKMEPRGSSGSTTSTSIFHRCYCVVGSFLESSRLLVVPIVEDPFAFGILPQVLKLPAPGCV